MLAPEGATLADMVGMAGFIGKRILPHVHVYVDDWEVPRDRWHVVRPKEGRSVYIQVRLHGGGGDGEDKNPLRTILMLAVIVVAAYFGGPGAIFSAGKGAGTLAKIGAFAANMAVSAAIATAGYALVNAIIPPPRPPGAQYGWGQQDGNPYAALTGIRNQFAPYSPVPRVLGKRRMFPMLAARPYTENLNGKQYLRMLLLVGYGRLRITDLRIGDSPISAFPGAAVEIREGTSSDAAITLFTRVVREDSLTIKLQRTEDTASGGSPPVGWVPGFDVWSTYDPEAPDVPLAAPAQVAPTSYTFSDPGGWVTRTSRTNTGEISLDITAPRGMYRANAQGRRYSTYVDVDVQWRAAGTSNAWTNAVWLEPNAEHGTGTNGKIRLDALSADPIVRSGRFSTGSSGQWEVRVRHAGPARGSDPTYVDDVYWSALRSISTDTPVTMPGIALIALRLEASEQLNGAPDTINCLAESYIPTFDGTSWDDANPIITSNPAWHYAHVMRWRGQNRVIPDNRIDGVGIKAWADACAVTAPNASEPRWTYDNVIEGGSIYQVLQDIAGHGRASFTLIDGKYSVVRDAEQTVPVMLITPRNSWGYEGRKAFVDIPHAFRCTFSNKDKNNEPDEVIVYRDGYAKEASTGVLAATKFELLNFPGATSSTQAWREGRYHIATLMLRPEEHSVSMDVGNLRCTKGDLVRFQWDVIKIGGGSGRIVGRTISAGNVTHLDLDYMVEMASGVSYALQVRKRDGTVVFIPLTTTPGSVETVQITTPIAEASAPAVGDLVAFGESGVETAPMIVKSIEPGEDLSARVVMVDAQAGVWTADTGTIPAFNTFITGRRHVQDAPAIPSATLTSSEAALLRLADGTLQERLMVRVIPRGNDQIAVARFEVQFRNAGGGDWTPAGNASPDAPVLYITNVTQGEAYDVRVRAWSNGGTPSAWASLTNHTIIGKSSVPADVTGLAVSRRIDGVVLTFNAVADLDLWAYEVRRGGANWAGGTHVGYFTATTIGLQETLATDTTYRVKAIDVVGLESANAASVTASATLPTFPGTAASVEWSGVTGAGKPADNATRNVTTSSATAPASPVNGDIWHDTSVTPQVTRIRVGGAWVIVSNLSTEVSHLTDGGGVLRPRPNLVRNGGFRLQGNDWALGNWFYSMLTDGPAIVCNTAGTQVASSARFSVQAGSAYTISAEGIGVNQTGGTLWIDIHWLDAGGSLLLDGANANFPINAGWNRVAATETAPTGATQAFVRAFVVGATYSAGGLSAIRLIKSEQASTASPFVDTATFTALYADGVPIGNLRPAEANANVTETRTAAAISGQGALATASTVNLATQVTGTLSTGNAASGLINANVGVGANAAINSTFEAGAVGWFRNVGTLPGSLLTNTGDGWARTYLASATTTAGYLDALYQPTGVFNALADVRRFALAVTPGDRVHAAALLAGGGGTTSVDLMIVYTTAAGAFGGQAVVASTTHTAFPAGDLTQYVAVGGFATVPAGAFWASLLVRAHKGTASGDGGAYVAEPQIAVVPAGQTAWPPYTPGPPDRRADRTGDNTAAAITGQGWGATATEAQARNSLITINANGTLSGAGSGQVTLAGLGGAVPMTATPDNKVRSGSRSGAGSVTTTTVVVTAAGGTSPYTYQWHQLGGEAATATASTSNTTAFQATIAVGETRITVWECVVTDNAGRSVSALVRAVFTETT